MDLGWYLKHYLNATLQFFFSVYIYIYIMCVCTDVSVYACVGKHKNYNVYAKKMLCLPNCLKFTHGPIFIFYKCMHYTSRSPVGVRPKQGN